MNLINLLKGIRNSKEIRKEKLPSLGLFYKDDFRLFIKKASDAQVNEYLKDYDSENIGVIIHKMKKVVKECTTYSEGYSFRDVKSIDIIFIFLEIVKYTKNKKISFYFFDSETGKKEIVDFSENSFNYYSLDHIMKYYDNENKIFEINNYKYSLPSIGVEDSLTKFLVDKLDDEDAESYNDYFFDFTHFLSDKNELSNREIDNLIQIFNFEITAEEMDKIQEIMVAFIPLQKYTLIKDGKKIDINSKMDLEKIWE